MECIFFYIVKNDIFLRIYADRLNMIDNLFIVKWAQFLKFLYSMIFLTLSLRITVFMFEVSTKLTSLSYFQMFYILDNTSVYNVGVSVQ